MQDKNVEATVQRNTWFTFRSTITTKIVIGVNFINIFINFSVFIKLKRFKTTYFYTLYKLT